MHDVLEDEVETANRQGVLPRVVDFLDHFDESLQVVVNCARKTEVTRWEFLFDIVGKPRDLFEVGRFFPPHSAEDEHTLTFRIFPEMRGGRLPQSRGVVPLGSA